MWLHNNLSTSETIALFSASYAVLCVLGIIFVFRREPGVQALYRRASILSPGRFVGLSFSQDIGLAGAIVLFLLLSTGGSGYQKLSEDLDGRRAVVLHPEVSVLGSPTEGATLQFKIHEGTVVTIYDRRAGWARIQLPGGLSGWVTASMVENV